MNVYEQLATHIDAWQNIVTGAGTDRDKATGQDYGWDLRLNDALVEALYHGDDMAARAVDLLPEHALVRGIDLTFPAAPELVQQLTDRVEDLDLLSAFQDAMIWGRLYGGAALYLGADDGGAPEEPLREDRIRHFDFVRTIDKRDLIPCAWYDDPISPRFGDPSAYRVIIMPASSGVPVVSNVVIHETRLLRFRGARTANRIRRQNYGWDHSVLQKVWATLQTFASAWQSAGNLLCDASQGVLKIKGLIDAMADGSTDALMSRMAVLDRTRSTLRSLVLDAENESFERVATPLSGIPDLLHLAEARIAAALEVPLTVLFGVSPAGLNATGESDIQIWHAKIQQTRARYIGPRLRRLLSMILLAKDGPTGGKLPEGWSIDFPSVYQQSPQEEAQTHATQATADSTYVTAGILTAEEIATSRFSGPSGYSLRTSVDVDAREALMATDALAAKLGGASEDGDVDEDVDVDGDEDEDEDEDKILRADYSPDQERDEQGKFAGSMSEHIQELHEGLVRVGQRLEAAEKRGSAPLRVHARRTQELLHEYAAKAEASGHGEHAVKLRKVAQTVDPEKLGDKHDQAVRRLEAAEAMPKGKERRKAIDRAGTTIANIGGNAAARAETAINAYREALHRPAVPRMAEHEWQNPQAVAARRQQLEQAQAIAVSHRVQRGEHPQLESLERYSFNVGQLTHEEDLPRLRRRVAAYEKALARHGVKV